MGDDLAAKIREAELAARRAEAREREKGRSSDTAAPLPRTRADAPLRPSAGGERLMLGQNDGGPVWLLEGRELATGDRDEAPRRFADLEAEDSSDLRSELRVDGLEAPERIEVVYEAGSWRGYVAREQHEQMSERCASFLSITACWPPAVAMKQVVV